MEVVDDLYYGTDTEGALADRELRDERPAEEAEATPDGGEVDR
jgi:hypothetical protein